MGANLQAGIVHAAERLIVTGAIALLVYEGLRLALLRKPWLRSGALL
jgi:hypothetical protein